MRSSPPRLHTLGLTALAPMCPVSVLFFIAADLAADGRIAVHAACARSALNSSAEADRSESAEDVGPAVRALPGRHIPSD
jgi:hypothetical protein